MVEALVCSKICEIDAQNIYGETALHIAASNLDFEMIKILRKYGASNQYKNNHGNTAVDNFRNAVNKSEEEKKITQKPDSINSTEITLRNPQLNEYLDLLLIDSDNSFLKDKNGNYLNQNCKFFDVVKKNSYDNLSEVSDLIKETSVNIVDSNNMSLLHYSIINENYDVFELLLKSNANIFVKNNLGEDPVGLAIRLDKIDMVKAMAKRKNMVPNSVFINDSSSTPPFLIAFNTNNEDMFKFLMTYFLDNIGKITSNKTNKVRLGFIEIIETILESNNTKK